MTADHMALGGGFAGEVSSIKLGDSGVEIVGVERDDRRDPLVGVELDDTEDLGAESVGSRVAARGAGTTEDQAAPPDRDGVEIIRLTPISASAENSAIMASLPFRISAPTSRRRSSRKTLSASPSAMAFQSRAAKCAWMRS